jgi:hypothetical protein
VDIDRFSALAKTLILTVSISANVTMLCKAIVKRNEIPTYKHHGRILIENFPFISSCRQSKL